MQPILEARDVTRRYRVGGGDVDAVRGVSLTVEAGEFVALPGVIGEVRLQIRERTVHLVEHRAVGVAGIDRRLVALR